MQRTGVTLGSLQARILHHADMNAHNTFANPDLIVPSEHKVESRSGMLNLALPPLSVVTVEAQAHLTVR